MREARGHQDNKLELWGDAPRYEYSTVPLMRADGLRPVSNPKAGSRGHALLLNDKQVRSAPVNPPPLLRMLESRKGFAFVAHHPASQPHVRS